MIMMITVDTPFIRNNPSGTISKFVSRSSSLGDISIRI